MSKLFIYFIILIGCCYNQVSAQHTAKQRHLAGLLNNAEKEFRDLRYSYAIPYFQSYLQARPNDSLANLHLAVSFRLVKQFDSALLYYKHFLSLYGQTEAQLAFAELAANYRQYHQAIAIYKQLEGQEHYRQLATERIRGFANPEAFLRDSLDYTLHYLKLNTPQDEYSPQFFRGGLVFVSNRYDKSHTANEFGWDGFPYAGIYQVTDLAELYTTRPDAAYHKQYNHTIKVNDDYTPATSNDNDIILVNNVSQQYTGPLHQLSRLSDEWKGTYNYGPLCFSADGKKVYFTRNAVNRYAGTSNLQICEAVNENGNWKQLRVMPFVDPAHDYYHPALSSDGNRLYFCSNRPGGQGGSDLYYVSLDGDPSQPVNLGSRINTIGNELFPTVCGDTLYFSSDGHAGLGGLDLYKTAETHSEWALPVNVGYPLNSSYDDFGIIFSKNRNQGYFTSNRLGSDDIFAFDRKAVITQLRGSVLSKADRRRMQGVEVTAVRQPHATDSMVTDITGNFSFPLKPTCDYTLFFSKTGYVTDSLTVKASGVNGILEIAPVFLSPVEPVVKAMPTVATQSAAAPAEKEMTADDHLHTRLAELAKNVYFKTASAVISPASLKPLNEIITLLKNYPGVVLTIEGHTDSRGSVSMNKKLSQQRADAIRDYFAVHGMSRNQLKTAGYGPDRPIADNATEAGRAMNRRVVMKAALQ